MIEQSLEELQRLYAEQGARSEKMVRRAVEALMEREEKLAIEVIETMEPACNQAEMEIEQKSTEIVARFCPRARDMRRLVAIIKSNGDLERIGDQAVNIAENALYLIPRRRVKPLIDIPRMGDLAADMVQDSLKSFLQKNIELANRVLEKDNDVDDFDEQITRELITYMASDPSTIERSMRIIFLSGSLERIGDLATNIAEDVIYYLTGEDIRHPGDQPEESEES